MVSLGSAARAGSAVTLPTAQQTQSQPSSSLAAMSSYVGRTVKLVELPGVPDADHLLQMLPQKAGQPLDRDQVRDSIRVLFSTGRFADIQAEVNISGTDVILTFTTSLNFFVGAIDVEGAPGHPSYNQIVNPCERRHAAGKHSFPHHCQRTCACRRGEGLWASVVFPKPGTGSRSLAPRGARHRRSHHQRAATSPQEASKAAA